MSWRLAKSLEKLRSQVNAAYPNRSKASDGTIGDTAHAASASDHNPNSAGVVCALDLTHHAGYFDAHALAEVLIRQRHPNLKYVISNSRIASASTGWNWVKYSGSNPHSKHIHVSVGNGSDGKSTGNYDSEINWDIGGDQMNNDHINSLFQAFFRRNAESAEHKRWIGKPATELIDVLRSQKAWKDTVMYQETGVRAVKEKWEERLKNNPSDFVEVKEKLYRKKG